MKTIGITGGIGAGKSVVSRILRCKGFEVYDCDSEARRLMDGSERLKTDIACRMGAHCILDSGVLDRRAIAEIVFSDDSHRDWLNKAVHEMVRNDLKARIAHCCGSVMFVESAILRTGALLPFCDEVWLVDAPEDIRLRRACSRDGADPDAVKKRMLSQAGEFSDFGNLTVLKIINDDRLSLLPQIDNQLKILNKC